MGISAKNGLGFIPCPSCDNRNRERGITDKGLSKTLRLYGIESTDIRFGEKSLKGYYRQPFEVAVARYIQEESGHSHTTGATSATEATEAIHFEPEELI